MIVIENPSPIHKFMANGNMPLLSTLGSAYPVKTDRQVPTRKVDLVTVKQHAFHYSGVTVIPRNAEVTNGPCGGEFCGCVNIYNHGVMAKACSCYQITQGEESICGIFDLSLILPEGKEIIVNNFSSKKLIAGFTKNGYFAPGMTAEALNRDRRSRLEFRRSIQQLFAYVNANGGYDVYGWTRRGLVPDQGADQPLPNQRGEPVLVPAGDLTYHLSFLAPSAGAVIVKSPEYEALKFDVEKWIVVEPTLDDDNESVQHGRKRKNGDDDDDGDEVVGTI